MKHFSKENATTGVSERAIENWLTKAGERSYQTAFCHLLNAMDYAVIHSTTHGPAEEGKDVIARDRRGKVAAFQLKRGNITVPKLRAFRGEINELVELPVRHPSVGLRAKHQPVLVTTGYINENVSSRIDGMNKSWHQRGYNPLTAWAGSELLMKFKEHTGKFLPQPVPEFHRLLGLMISTGKGPLDKAEFDLLLRSILHFSESQNKVRKKEAATAIAAFPIIVEYALAGFDQARNHFAKIEAYTMLFCYMRALALRLRLPEKLWMATVKLVERAVDTFARQLSEETQSLRGFGQGSPFTEPVVAPYRKTLLAGAIAAHGLWCILGGTSDWYNKSKDSVVKNVLSCSQKTLLPAESFVPARFLASEFLRHNGHIGPGDAIFRDLLRHCILRKQDVKGVKPLWGPYLSIEEAIMKDLGERQESLIPERWEHNSYTAYGLILVAASRLLRQDLESLWHPITSLHFNEVVADRAWQMLLWQNKKGTLVEKMVPRPQSWRKLRDEAHNRKKLPRAFTKMIHWLPYYLLVFPHRFNPGPVLALANALGAVSRSSQ